MRTLTRLRGAPPVLAFFIIGCTIPNPDFDPNLEDDSGAPAGDYVIGALDGTVASDVVAPKPGKDAALPAPDTATPPPPPPPPPTGPGAICTEQKDCGADELCIFAEPEATKGICLRECSNSDKPCELADPKLFSGCATYWNPHVGKVSVCVIFCKGPNGASFPCPNPSSLYKCRVYDSGLGMCIPK